jgi:hypothetical protein
LILVAPAALAGKSDYIFDTTHERGVTVPFHETKLLHLDSAARAFFTRLHCATIQPGPVP